MPRATRCMNLLAVLLPFAAFVAAVVLLWNRAVDAIDLVLLAVMYVSTALGVTVGYHRMLTHRSFQSPRPVEWGFAILGSMAVQGPVIDWVADHRKHHAHTDREGDPHSPHTHEGSGWRGLLYAHMGWLLDTQGGASKRRYARDLVEDPAMRRISKLFPLWLALGLALPAVAGGLLHGSWDGVWRGLLWGGLVRIFLVHHVTWSVNSVCHFFGRRRFDVSDHSTNVAWLAVPSFGEAWHHNHHAFPRSAFHGLRPWEIDISGLLIRGLEAVGLARNVVRIPPERQAERLAERPRRRVAA